MTGVVNCVGGHRTRLREDLVCLWGAPSHVYKGGEGEGRRPKRARQEGVQLGFPILVGFPFLFEEGEGGMERERERKEGATPPPPSSIWTTLGGAPPCGLPSPTPSLFPPVATPEKEKRRRGILLGLGSPSRTPHTWRAPRGPATSSPFIYGGGGHPKGTTDIS